MKISDKLPSKRKGLGYMVEAMVASLTLFIFAFSQAPAEPAQNWNQFQKQIAANDLSYTLKQTGDMTPLLKRQETGSLQTAASAITGQNLEVAGTVENLPLNDATIGFNAVASERHTDSIRDVQSSDTCDGDLEEIDQQGGTTIKRTEDPGEHDNVVLYFADTDPGVSGGFNDETDYDTMYVDNLTRCQFAESEGPFYIDEFFRWNTSSAGEYEHYDFKNVDGNNNEFTYFNATQAVMLQRQMNKPLNGIDTSQSFDVFNLADTDLNTYDLVVLKKNEAIGQLNTNTDQRQKIEDFMEDKPILILANLTQGDTNSGFISRIGFEWIDLEYTSKPDKPSFSSSSRSEEVETYFDGLDGDIGKVELPPGGNVSSAIGDSMTQDDPLFYASEGSYNTTPWNASNFSMENVDPSSVTGEPESSCYSLESSALTEGVFEFPREDSGGTVEYDVINSEMGSSPSNCNDVRALSIDYNPENGRYDDPGEGPFLNGEKIIVEGREYKVVATQADGDTAEFVFNGNSDVELANYRTSYEEINGGGKTARIAYKEEYSDNDRKLISSTIYWLLGDTTRFGQRQSSPVSTTTLASVDENVYMPYRLSMRWK